MTQSRAVLLPRARGGLLFGRLTSLVLLAVVSLAVLSAPQAAARSPGPSYSGPVTGGLRERAWNQWPWALPAKGYSEAEYFLSGQAHAFGGSAADAPYTVRVQVYRPTTARFDGTVFVEWNNVTGQVEIDPVWYWAHPQVFRQGAAYVLASVQQTGECGTSVPDLVEQNGHGVQTGICNPVGLKGWDPVRYAPLQHPGDDYMYDIFSQIVTSIRAARGAQPFARLKVRRVVALGHSQSAQLLDVWLCNGAARGVDGVLIDADFGRGPRCTPAVPTLQLLSEESAVPMRSTSRKNVRTWMVPGAPHVDTWAFHFVEALVGWNEAGRTSSTYEDLVQAAGDYGQTPGSGASSDGNCAPRGNSYPRRYAVDAALTALRSWITGGAAPIVAGSLAFTGSGPTQITSTAQYTPPDALKRDPYGNAVGGFRSPVLDVPVATYVGATCTVMGKSQTLDLTLLRKLYPTHRRYISALARAADNAVRGGRLTVADATDLIKRACHSTIGGTDRLPCPRVSARSPYTA